MERSSLYRRYAEGRILTQQEELKMERETVKRLTRVVGVYTFVALLGWIGFVVALCSHL